MSNTNNKCFQLLTSAHDCHRQNQVSPAPLHRYNSGPPILFQDNARNRDTHATNETKVVCPHPLGTERGKADPRGRAQDIQGGACHYTNTAHHGAGADSHCPQASLPLSVRSSKAGSVTEQESMRLLEIRRFQGPTES